MLKLNVKRLMAAISEAEAFTSPFADNPGMEYLYDKIYTAAASGKPVCMRDIDFDGFTLEDVEAFEGYYDNTLSRHNTTADCVSEALRKTHPLAAKARFI